MEDVQKADGDEIAGLVLSPVVNATRSQGLVRKRSLLPGPFASAISLVTATSAFSLRVGGLLSNVAIHGAKITTLTGFELGRAVLEGVLARAGQDVVETSSGQIGRAAAETLLQRAVSSLHHAITHTSFLVSAGFQLGSTSLNTSLAIGQYLLSALDAVFGDNETSKAIATIIVLVQREINSPDIVGEGEKLSTVDIITGVAGFALLQQWSKQQTKEELQQSGAVDIVWDIVVLADADTQTMALTANANDSPLIGSSSAERSPEEQRPHSSASFMSALRGDNSFEGVINDDNHSFMSVTSNRRPFEPVLDSSAEQAFREQLVGQLKPGTTVRITTQSMTINSVTVEIDGDDPALLEPPTGYSLVSADESDASHRTLVYQTQSSRQKRGKLDVSGNTSARDHRHFQRIPSISNTAPSGHVAAQGSFPAYHNHSQALALSSPQSEGFVVTNDDDDMPNLANQKRQRSYPSLHPGGQLDGFDLSEKKRDRPSDSRRHSLKQSLKTTASYRNLVDLFNSGNPRKRLSGDDGAARTQKELSAQGRAIHIPTPASPTTQGNRILPALSQMQRPISPMTAMRRPVPNPSRRHAPSSLGVPARTSSISSGYQMHPRTGLHSRPTSSIYSVAASESSLVLRSGDRGSSEPVSRSLNRDGHLPGQFPQMSFANNAARFCRFSLASYGSSFLRFIGAASPTAPHIIDFTSNDHYEHQSFVSYARLPSSTVLLSSFVDPKGVPVAIDQSNSGTVLVHFVSLDHEAKSVVLSCRGTVGFEDILTDLTANYEDFIWEGHTYQVHQGILAAARKLLSSHGGRVLATIRAALEEFTDYGIVLCGHSLGGGVASVLAIMLAQRNGNKLFGSSAFVTSLQPERQAPIAGGHSGIMSTPEFNLPPGRPIHVYAYGPAASVSPPLQEATKGLITSIVHGRDSIPFLSLGTLRDFQHVALAFKIDDTKGEIRRRVWDGLREALKEKTGLGSRNTLFGNAWLLHDDGQEDDQWPWLCLQSLRAGLQSQKLVPAGDVFHIQSTPVLQRHAFVQSDGRREEVERSFKPATHLVVTHVADVEHFCREVMFSTSMFHDHVPLRYEKVLDKLEKGLGG